MFSLTQSNCYIFFDVSLLYKVHHSVGRQAKSILRCISIHSLLHFVRILRVFLVFRRFFIVQLHPCSLAFLWVSRQFFSALLARFFRFNFHCLSLSQSLLPSSHHLIHTNASKTVRETKLAFSVRLRLGALHISFFVSLFILGAKVAMDVRAYIFHKWPAYRICSVWQRRATILSLSLGAFGSLWLVWCARSKPPHWLGVLEWAFVHVQRKNCNARHSDSSSNKSRFYSCRHMLCVCCLRA